MNAEQGFASGAAVSVTTKSGTNIFHGSAWEYNMISALMAKSPFFVPTTTNRGLIPKYIMNQFGANYGGPILKNKAFFYVTYEGLRIHQVTLFNLADITPAEEAGNFSGVSTQLHDPYNATCASNGNGLGTGTTACNYTAANGYPGTGTGQTPGANNQIPKTEWDTVSENFLNNTPYIPVASQTTGLFSGQVPYPLDGNQYTIRGDYRTTQHDLTYVRFFHMVDTSTISPPPYGSYFNVNDYDIFSEPNWGTTIRDTHTFSQNLIGDFGFSDTNITTNGTPEGTIVTLAQMGGTIINFAISKTGLEVQAAQDDVNRKTR